MDQILSLVDEIKEKINSEEYKVLVEKIAEVNDKQKILIKELCLEYSIIISDICDNCEEQTSKIVSIPMSIVKIRILDECNCCCMNNFLSHLSMHTKLYERIKNSIETIGYYSYCYNNEYNPNVVYSLIFSKRIEL
tara:strand:+ start:996 stop:1403 length:408 start_codon:yes stop_codon:yes gene_type:complete